MLTAVAMAAGCAHLFELPHKIGLSREDYLTVQRIYRGWALLGIVVAGALVSTAALAVQVRRTPTEFYLTVAAALCIALSLVVFFMFTFPANRQTANWTVLPENWQELRRRWEYSHAVGTGGTMGAAELPAQRAHAGWLVGRPQGAFAANVSGGY